MTVLIDLDCINLKVKHPALIKLKDLKRVEGWLEHMMIIGHQMILNLMGTLKMKILIGDEDMVPDDSEDPLGPDKIGFYTFFLKGQGNPPDLMGVDDDQLLAIQNDLRERLKARDEARGRVVARKLLELTET